MSKKKKTPQKAMPELSPPETIVESAPEPPAPESAPVAEAATQREPTPDARLAELEAAYADARNVIAIYRHLRMAPVLQAKAERLFAALDAVAHIP